MELLRPLVIFESATDAALKSRVGAMSGFDNELIIERMKCVCTGHIHSNAFVVVDGKTLMINGLITSLQSGRVFGPACLFTASTPFIGCKCR
jgi:hypothetical protein